MRRHPPVSDYRAHWLLVILTCTLTIQPDIPICQSGKLLCQKYFRLIEHFSPVIITYYCKHHTQTSLQHLRHRCIVHVSLTVGCGWHILELVSSDVNLQSYIRQLCRLCESEQIAFYLKWTIHHQCFLFSHLWTEWFPAQILQGN